MNKNHREAQSNLLMDPELKMEYDALAVKYQLVNTILDARITMNISQKQLAEMSGIALRDIVKIENGNANPSLKTIERIAASLGMAVKIAFIPVKQTCH